MSGPPESGATAEHRWTRELIQLYNELTNELRDLSRRLERGLPVVGDVSSTGQIRQQILEGDGYRAVVAADSPEALAIFGMRGPAISAVPVDLMMPPSTIRALQRINPRGGASLPAASSLPAV